MIAWRIPAAADVPERRLFCTFVGNESYYMMHDWEIDDISMQCLGDCSRTGRVSADPNRPEQMGAECIAALLQSWCQRH
jgi:hypothetical protein